MMVTSSPVDDAMCRTWWGVCCGS